MNVATRAGINSLGTDDFAEALVMIKHRAGVLGLLKTMHALEAGVKAIGWELAEKIEATQRTAIKDAESRAAHWSRT